MGVGAGANRDHQHAAPFRQRFQARKILIRHVVLAAAEIADLGLEAGDARGDLAADLAHAVDADLAAAHAGLRPHHRRRLCRGPVAAPHVIVGHQQPPRRRQHQRHRDVGDRGRIRARAVADGDLALRRGREIDAVIAGAVADDRAELRHQVHHVAAERRAARRDHRANAGQLFRLKTLHSAVCPRHPAVRSARRCAASGPWGSANRSGLFRALFFFLWFSPAWRR